jgi:hypothetical protein
MAGMRQVALLYQKSNFIVTSSCRRTVVVSPKIRQPGNSPLEDDSVASC